MPKRTVLECGRSTLLLRPFPSLADQLIDCRHYIIKFACLRVVRVGKRFGGGTIPKENPVATSFMSFFVEAPGGVMAPNFGIFGSFSPEKPIQPFLPLLPAIYSELLRLPLPRLAGRD